MSPAAADAEPPDLGHSAADVGIAVEAHTGEVLMRVACEDTTEGAGALSSAESRPSTSQDVQSQIDAAVEAGMMEAAGVKSHEEFDFKAPEIGGWAKPATREAAWMRVELSKLMAGVGASSLPPGGNGFQYTFKSDPVQRRRGDASVGGGTRRRPRIYSAIVDDAHAYVVNFATKENNLTLAEFGLGSVPCANEKCKGSCGRSVTLPLEPASAVLSHSNPHPP